MKRQKLWVLGALLYLAGLVYLVYWFFVPKYYLSTACLRVEPDSFQTEISREPTVKASNYDLAFLRTEAQIISSESVLTNVIHKLDLNRKWGMMLSPPVSLKTVNTMSLLRSSMDVDPIPNTRLIEIRVKSESPEEAAYLANALAERYQEFRLRNFFRQGERTLDALNNRLQAQDEQIEELQRSLEKIQRTLKVPCTPESDHGQESFTSQTEPYFKTKRQLEDLQRFRQVLRTRADAEMLNLCVHRDDLVQIVDHATPAAIPFSPSKSRFFKVEGSLVGLGTMLMMASGIALAPLRRRFGT